MIQTVKQYVVLVLAMMCSTGAWADAAIDRPNFNCSGGDGSRDNPWLISSIADMNELARQINMEMDSEEQKRENPHLWGNLVYYNGYGQCYFKLTCDLDYSNEPVVNGSNYTPVGIINFFCGIFDGCGHTISGIKINRTGERNGIFGNISGASYIPEYGPGIIKNLTLANSEISGGNYTGGIVGECNSTVYNCHVLSSVTISAAADSTECVGGVVGKAWYNRAGYYNLGGGQVGGYWDICVARVEGCTNAATVSTDGKSGCSQLGGIVGGVTRGGYVYNNLNTGEVDTRVVNSSAGGVIGNSAAAQWIEIFNNYYAAPCNVGGLYGEDTEGARMAVISDTQPEDIGDVVEEYASVGTMLGLTVYKNGIFYNGKYYYYDKALGEFFPLYAGDEGTEARPYQIKTIDDLRTLARAVDYDTDFADKYFVLTADLDFGGGTEGNFKPIGGIYNFAGTFDGQGHTVSGIVVDRPNSYNGLFGQATHVKNVTLSNSTIVANCNGTPTSTSIVATQTGGIVGYTTGTIENCHVSSSVTIRVAQNYTSNVGGIAGYCKGKILGCTSRATITSEFADSRNLGGIVGITDNATLNHCIGLGPVISANEWAGSVVGYDVANEVIGKRNSKFDFCYYAGQSNKGGLEGAEIDNVWKAEERTTKPSAFLSKVTEYKSFASMPAITVYKNCLLYNGIYYYHNPNNAVCGHFPVYEGDEGTAEKPFQLKTKADINALGRDVNINHLTFEGMTFALKNDVDYEGYITMYGERYWHSTNYTPIGHFYSYPFVATFDGEGHTIKGISIQQDESTTTTNEAVGIIGYLGAGGVVKNLSVDDSQLCIYSNGGAIAGQVNGGRVENCHVLSQMVFSPRRDYTSKQLGGIAGVLRNDGTVTGCTNQATICYARDGGGIVGDIWGGTVSDCLNLGKVELSTKATDPTNVIGAIVGNVDDEGTISVTNCYYAGECTVGGIGNNDTEGARKATVSATKPQEIGSVETVYPSFEGAPGLTAYNAGLFFDGQYYSIFAGGETPTYTVTDVKRLFDIISGKEAATPAADLNGDGQVNITDIILMLKMMIE